MTEIANPLAAVIAYLAADPDCAALVQGRVFGESLPEGESGAMPRACLVVAASPGYPSVGARSRLPLYALRCDLKCYGETPFEAARLYFAAHTALVNLDRQTVAGVLLHDAIVETSLMQIRDADGAWPLAFGTYTVLAAMIAVI